MPHVTSDGCGYYVDGVQRTAVAAHRALIEDGHTDYDERVELLESIKAHPEENPK
ncbi:hypothetical protein F4561_002622 [Lipingzhangella halophila]|uniref:Uncharacterized protein n=1 Tax=Lipingzhangella halophila TaxID=1783352 RepID=A0A7W7RGZ9_9ACTN|nr:hypothetical protein [Lipingzhangella halophila]MBB4931802.1 hypothetical protein [Lipingzhangella halophila]